ncbi:hypothetical protein HYU09_04360 [Candidatus Woesearchaeota archaeon]|nr:hypothetical protein [Candidatus Woesearchaeota archaeon]
MKKIIFALLVLGLYLIASCVDDKPNEDQLQNGKETSFGGFTKEQCDAANGYWNECGSPCAGTDAEVCIQMCQVQCECGGIAGFGCPSGYKCRLTGKIADEMGVCVKE